MPDPAIEKVKDIAFTTTCEFIPFSYGIQIMTFLNLRTPVVPESITYRSVETSQRMFVTFAYLGRKGKTEVREDAIVQDLLHPNFIGEMTQIRRPLHRELLSKRWLVKEEGTERLREAMKDDLAKLEKTRKQYCKETQHISQGWYWVIGGL